MMRGSRADVTCPHDVLVLTPLALYFTDVSTASNCVWLNALYASARNWAVKRSRIRKYLKIAVLKLLRPGPRTTPLGVLPMLTQLIAGQVPEAHCAAVMGIGSVNAAVLNHWFTDRWPEGGFGLPTRSGRAPSPALKKFTVGLVLIEMFNGAPAGMYWVMSEICQPSNTVFTKRFCEWKLGRAHRRLKLRMFGRS